MDFWRWRTRVFFLGTIFSRFCSIRISPCFLSNDLSPPRSLPFNVFIQSFFFFSSFFIFSFPNVSTNLSVSQSWPTATAATLTFLAPRCEWKKKWSSSVCLLFFFFFFFLSHIRQVFLCQKTKRTWKWKIEMFSSSSSLFSLINYWTVDRKEGGTVAESFWA